MSKRLNNKKAKGLMTQTAARAIVIAMIAATVGSAYSGLQAQGNPAVQHSGYFETHYGWNPYELTRPYEPGTRDANGNRFIQDGRILTNGGFSTLQGGLVSNDYGSQYGSYHGGGFGGSSVSNAVGNQLNVTTYGDNNTVIVNSTQINHGDQTIILNGELNFND